MGEGHSFILGQKPILSQKKKSFYAEIKNKLNYTPLHNCSRRTEMKSTAHNEINILKMHLIDWYTDSFFYNSLKKIFFYIIRFFLDNNVLLMHILLINL